MAFRIVLLLLVLTTFIQSSWAQISGVVNSYTAVTAINLGQSSVTVTNPASFAVGDTILIIQMTGAAINETNTAGFGDTTALNSAGNYELKKICDITGNEVSFSKEFQRTYNPVGGAVQLVTVPNYSSVTITGTLTCTPWNGATGGVLALRANGTLSFAADIDVSGMGFRGGAPNTNLGPACGTTDYFLPLGVGTGAGKGEGIAAFIASKEMGRGKQANGGGGGNSWAAGGAGGSNAAVAGQGGNEYDAGGCSGTSVGGVPGFALPYSNVVNRVFMGGGGGAGNAPANNTAGMGGAGGGIVLISASEIDGSGNAVLANGANGTSTVNPNGEGAGGAGAGGTVLLRSTSFISNLTVSANGGNGGDNANTTNCYGTGGGGSGGTVWSELTLPGQVTVTTNGGAAGTKIGGPGGCAGTNYGATNGSGGVTLTGLNILIGNSPQAGGDTIISVCETAAAVDLFANLAGSPDAGGTWIDENLTGALTGNIFNASMIGSGSYNFSYAVNSGLCATDTARIRVGVVASPDAGTNGNLTACDDAVSVDLTAGLGGTPQIGGTWNDDDNTSALFGHLFNPVLVGAGTYNFTYTVNAVTPCTGSASATVTVTVTASPDAGNNGVMFVCNTETAVNLDGGLGGTPDGGGIWLDDDATGALTGNMFDASAVSTGSYNFTYVVTGTLPCVNDSATVNVTVTAAPDPGTNGTLSVCDTETAVDLITGLGGTPDAGGTWLDDDNTGAIGGGFFNASIMPGGTYNFTYVLIGAGGCLNDSATVAVTVNEGSNAGTDVSTNACENEIAFDLFPTLGGSPDAGGIWLDDDNTSALTGSLFDASQVGVGTYHFTYVVNGTPPCANDSATVTVVVVAIPNAGTNGTLTACENDGAVDLFTGLNGTPQLGGTWSDDDNTGALTGGIFDASQVGAGTYNFSYTVPGFGPCPDSTATVTVTATIGPDAGVDGNLTSCQTQTALDLNTGLGGTPDGGGTWLDDDNTGALTGNVFNATMVTLGSYNFTYVVNGTPPCANDSATVTVTVGLPPNAGTNGTLNVCDNQSVVNLITGLGGTPNAGGVWNDDDNTGALTGGIFNATMVTTGTYHFTYTVSASGCPDSSATVTVNVTSGPSAGLNNTIDACITNNTVDVFAALGGTPQAGGTWTDNDNTGALTGSTFDATAVAAGTYTFTYTVNAVPPCAGTASAIVTVTVVALPDAGSNGTATACETQTAIDLFSHLNGSPQTGGTWNDDDATGALSGGVFNASQVGVGIYNFTYTVTAVTPCPDSSATVTVTVVASPNGGIDTAITVCDSITPLVNLFAQLAGNPDVGGNWTDDDNSGALSGGTFDAATAGAGTYNFTYTVSGTAPCSDSSATITVTVFCNNPPVAVDDNITTTDTDTETINVQGNDSDPDGDPLTTTIIGGTNNGSAAVDGNGNITYSANFGFCGTDTITYMVCDPLGLCDTALVVITVTLTDSDADGVPDFYETLGANTDGDGVPDHFDLDSDGDGIPDSVEGTGDVSDPCNPEIIDTDNDGTFDFQDTDSDGDGIPDAIEAGSDPNNPVDSDGDGIPDYRDPDSDNDGRPDSEEGAGDCDADGIPNYKDDNDSDCDVVLIIPEGFSPNGDGVNEDFEIVGLHLYSDNKLTIFNRWGNEVFQAEPYENDWDGDGLPIGTYYYILELGEGFDTHTGYIYLTR